MKVLFPMKYWGLFFGILFTIIGTPLFAQNMINGTISTCDTYIYDDGGPAGDYSETNYEMTVCASSGTTLYFVLESLNLGATVFGDEDILIIYEGTGTGGTVLFDSQTNSAPSGIGISVTGCITITLDTDPDFFSTDVGPGFELLVSCTLPETCSDGILNNGEVMVDCGGPNCSPCLVFTACSPELIYNGDFETLDTQTNGCATMTDSQIRSDSTSVDGWYGTTTITGPQSGITPDYGHSPPCGINPNIGSNFHACNLGNGSLGFFPGAEEIQGRLNSPLEAGEEYCLSVKVDGRTPTSDLFFWFHSQPFTQGNGVYDLTADNGGNINIVTGPIGAIPQVVNNPSNVIPNGCHDFFSTFCATGGETNVVVGGSGAFANGYLVIDDFSLKKSCPLTFDSNISVVGTVDCAGSCADLVAETSNQAGGCQVTNDFDFQWYKDGVLMSGETNRTLISVCPTNSTTYSVEITYSAGCKTYTKPASQTTLTLCSSFTVTVDVDPADVCKGDCSDLTATPSPTGTYTYSWTEQGNPTVIGATDVLNVCPTTTTVYEVEVSDGANTEIGIATVTVYPLPTIDAGADITICPGDNASLAASGGSTYNWNNGLGAGANQTVSPTSTTTYTVTGIDANSCESTDQIDVIVSPIPDVTITKTDLTCGNTDGTINITLNNTVPSPVIYVIGNGVPDQTDNGSFTGLSAGSYSITVTDANGCFATGAETLTNSGSTDDASFTLTDFCEGTTNSATITGTSGGTFSIVSPLGDGATIDATTGEITNGVGGTTYSIQYVTSGACPDTQTQDITVNPSPTFTVATTDPSCGNNDGEITINPTSLGTITSYSIDNGTTSQPGSTFPNLGAGSYSILITDANNCEATGTESLSNIGGATIDNMNTTDPSCSNDDGEIKVVATGGATPYTFQWYDENNNPIGTNSATINGLSAGDYSVEVTDFNGCTASDNATLNPATGTDDASFTLTDFCEGTANSANISGTLGGTFSIVSPTGGTATINASTGEITNGVSGTTYTIQYETSSACPATQTQDVTVNSSPTYTANNTDPSCGNSDGEIVIIPSTGATITDYSIDNGTTTQTGGTFSGLAAGGYTIIIVDANGCEATGTENLSNTSGPTISNISPTDASCNADDGTIAVLASGGATPLSYKLDNGQTSSNGTFTGLADGIYTVTVTDPNGCLTNQSVTVGKISGPTATVVGSTDVSCFGESDGTGEVSATGGTAPYTYDWTPVGGNAAKATGLAAGTYTIMVKDNAGCSDQVQITISAPTEITVDKTITNSDCGLDNGEIALNVTGGSGNYTYVWDPNVSTSDEATDLAVGNYEVTVTDDDGCVKTVNYNVNLGNSFYIEAIPDSSTILQGASVDLHLFVDPNITIDTIVWTPSIGLSCSDCKDPVATPEFSTTYIVTVTDDNGCTSTDTVKINVVLPCAEIFVPNTFSPNSDGLNDLQCVLGECIVSLEFTIFNRWGEPVFYAMDQKECWDGTFRGKLVQSGVYVYKLKATLEDGEKVERTGNVTVVR